MSGLTAREQAAMRAITAAVAERGYPPTVRELGDAIGLASAQSVHSVLTRLERKGVIRRVPRSPRAIQILDPGGAP